MPWSKKRSYLNQYWKKNIVAGIFWGYEVTGNSIYRAIATTALQAAAVSHTSLRARRRLSGEESEKAARRLGIHLASQSNIGPIESLFFGSLLPFLHVSRKIAITFSAVAAEEEIK